MSANIIPLNKNIKKDDDDAIDGKSMMMEMAMETFLEDPAMDGIKSKVGGMVKIIAKPAFRQFLKMMGRDTSRFMVYIDTNTDDIILHKFKIKDDTSEEPKEGEMKVTAPDGRKIMLKADGTWREVSFDEHDSSVILEFLYTPEAEEDIILRINEKDLENTDDLFKQLMSKFGGSIL